MWVAKARGSDLDLVVFECPSLMIGNSHSGYFGTVAVFFILAQSTPGFILNMFNQGFDNRADVAIRMQDIIDYVTNSRQIPDIIFGR